LCAREALCLDATASFFIGRQIVESKIVERDLAPDVERLGFGARSIIERGELAGRTGEIGVTQQAPRFDVEGQLALRRREARFAHFMDDERAGGPRSIVWPADSDSNEETGGNGDSVR